VKEYTVVGICTTSNDGYVGWLEAPTPEIAAQLSHEDHAGRPIDREDSDLLIAAVFEGWRAHVLGGGAVDEP